MSIYAGQHTDFSEQDQGRIMSTAARATIAVLSKSAWGATRRHHSETEALAARHKTRYGKVSVVLTENEHLKEVNKIHRFAYKEHVRLTLPTVQEGMRILPARRMTEHSDTFKKLALEHKDEVKKFIDDFEEERRTAPTRLAGLYDPSHWPTKEEVLERFSFEVRYLPCPTEGKWAIWLKESAELAEADLRKRITEALERVRDRCSSNGRLFTTVFSNIKDLVELAPDLNLSKAPDIITAAQRIEDMLDGADIQGARANEDYRAHVAHTAEGILAQMKGGL